MGFHVISFPRTPPTVLSWIFAKQFGFPEWAFLPIAIKIWFCFISTDGIFRGGFPCFIATMTALDFSQRLVSMHITTTIEIFPVIF
jgi:hypothetical protein